MRKAIGILGGLGPAAGLDLLQKIILNTNVTHDQEHYPVLLFSLPGEISGRPEYLLDKTLLNPAYAMGSIMVELAKNGAAVIGIPCNTAHSPEILEIALSILKESAPDTKFIHIIEAEASYIKTNFPNVKNLGILCTEVAYTFGLFHNAPALKGYELLFPDAQGRQDIQAAISNPSFGIKVQANPVSNNAISRIEEQLSILIANGADAILLACSELPLALTQKKYKDTPIVDSTDVLAQALIKEFLEN